MPVRVRLTRVGNRNNPIWRVVVADDRSPRDGRFIEVLGHYNPQRSPSEIKIDEERLGAWLQRGAQPTRAVAKLVEALRRGQPPAAELRADEARRERERARSARAAEDSEGAAANAEQGGDGSAEAVAEASAEAPQASADQTGGETDSAAEPASASTDAGDSEAAADGGPAEASGESTGS